MANVIEIETKGIKGLTKALKNSHKSALPNVVRSTLNDLAFLSKKDTLEKSTKKLFKRRNKTFFKANSAVSKATGYDVTTMSAEIGMTKKNKSSRNLVLQEKGGRIPDRSFIAMKGARTGKSADRQIRKNKYLSKIQLIDTDKSVGNENSKLVKSVVKAKELNKQILHNGTVFDVRNVRTVNRRLRFRLVPLYSYKKGRSVKVPKAPFMQNTAMLAIKDLKKIFKNNSKRQADKLRKKYKL